MFSICFCRLNNLVLLSGNRSRFPKYIYIYRVLNRKDAKTKNHLIYTYDILWLFYTSKAEKPLMEYQI